MVGEAVKVNGKRPVFMQGGVDIRAEYRSGSIESGNLVSTPGPDCLNPNSGTRFNLQRGF